MQRITQLWKSGVRGKLFIGCGGLLALLLVCGLFSSLFGRGTAPQATKTPTPVAAQTAIVATPKPTAAPVATSTPKPTATSKPTDTPKPTNTPKPTDTPRPPTVSKPTSAVELVLDVPGILGKSVTEVEKSLGKSTEILPMRVGDAEELPEGGESRTYHHGKYTSYVFFNRDGVARGFQVIEGLTEESYSLDQWGVLLTRFGFAVYKLPDVEAPAARRWNNFNGYKISIFANKTNGPVWSVQIWKIQTQTGLDTSTPRPIQTIGTLYVSAGGEGVYIRSQPDREARVKVWPDGTAMGLIEKAPSGWAKVQAPDGYVGYIPLEYLADKIPPTRTPAPTQPPAPPPSASTVGGPPVTVNGWTWSVYEVKKEKAVYFYQDSAVAEGTFYILFLRITNGRSGTSYPEKDLDFYLLDASGKRYTTSRFEYYAQWQYGGKADSFGEIQPGQTGEIILLYDVPSGATGLRLVGTRDGQGAISIP